MLFFSTPQSALFEHLQQNMHVRQRPPPSEIFIAAVHTTIHHECGAD
jgi:hypothetical protein